MSSKLILLAALAASAVARTDLKGCTYYDSVVDPGYYAPYATRIWYVPDTGELCELLDCGGGRAPPKTTVPGCGNYAGTDTYSPRFIDPKTLGEPPKTSAGSASAAATTTRATSEAVVTSSSVTSAAASAPLTTSTLLVGDSIVSAPVSATDLATTLVLETGPKATPTGDGAETSGAAGNDAASTPASTSASTARGSVATPGAMMVFAAGAAVYAGLL